jgi:hypothetical protein
LLAADQVVSGRGEYRAKFVTHKITHNNSLAIVILNRRTANKFTIGGR